jgi:Holliday junction resolvase RusA-like endonuclease
MTKISIYLSGQPVGKGRPRFTRTGHAYTPVKTRRYEHKLAAEASNWMMLRSMDPITQPCRVAILAQFQIPKSWPKRRREAATAGEVYPGLPDIDNVAKIALDALNGVCFEDDKQVYELKVSKRYGEPMILIEVDWD